MAHPGYYVWNPARSYPSARHSTLNSASNEAKRLAGAHPGASFFVMAPVAVAHTATPDVKFELVEQGQPTTADLDSEIPF